MFTLPWGRFAQILFWFQTEYVIIIAPSMNIMLSVFEAKP